MGDGLRVSDQDRERVAGEIREHFAAGRLTDDELSDRLSAVYKAQTEDELAAVRADLPRLPVAVRAEIAQRRAQLQRRLLQEAGGGVAVFLVCTGIWAASGANGSFWPIWVALVAVIPLIRNGWRLYGPAPDFESVERDLERRRSGRRHDRHRSRSGYRSDRRSDR